MLSEVPRMLLVKASSVMNVMINNPPRKMNAARALDEEPHQCPD